MFSILDAPGPFPTLALVDDGAPSRAELVPGRGGIVTRWSVGGRDVLFLDDATLRDPAANVRGGVPILFPSPGKLAGDAWSRDGRSGSLKQHGFARNRPWQVVERSTDGAARVRLRLDATGVPLSAWAWPCAVDIVFTLAGASLRLDVRVDDRADTTMPFGFGLHPYFAVRDADKPRLRIPTAATRAFDNVAKREVAFTRFDFTREVDLHLLDHGAAGASLELPDGAQVALRASPEFSHWVVWSIPGRDFVCLEPWTCPGDALNTGDRLLHVPAGAERSLFVELELRA